MRQAEEGIARLAENVDTLIVIPNDRLKDVIAVSYTHLRAHETR